MFGEKRFPEFRVPAGHRWAEVSVSANDLCTVYLLLTNGSMNRTLARLGINSVAGLPVEPGWRLKATLDAGWSAVTAAITITTRARY